MTAALRDEGMAGIHWDVLGCSWMQLGFVGMLWDALGCSWVLLGCSGMQPGFAGMLWDAVPSPANPAFPLLPWAGSRVPSVPCDPCRQRPEFPGAPRLTGNFHFPGNAVQPRRFPVEESE